MNKVLNLLFAALMLLFSVSLQAQFTRQQAIDLVMNDIVAGEDGNVSVYATFDSRTQQQDVVLSDTRIINCVYTDNWVFLIDDIPSALWHHACRYVFVSGQNGDYTIVDDHMFAENLETDYEMISAPSGHEQITFPEYTGNPVLPESPNDHLFAVLVGGSNQHLFWTDISMIYNTLLEKGYKKENIFVHFYDAGGSYGNGLYDDDLDGDLVYDDVDYVASLEALQTTFDNLSGESTSNPEIPILEHGDQLLVHLDSHGNTYDLGNQGSYFEMWGNGYQQLYDTQLAIWMEPIDCSQILVVMQQCYSGGFIDDLTDYITYSNTLCKNRRVITAANYDESAHMEFYISGGGQYVLTGVYGEFDFYFYSAMRGAYPDVNPQDGFDPWEPSYDLGEFPFYLYPEMIDHPDDYDPDVAYGNDDGIIQIGEAFTYSDDFDTWSHHGYFLPYLEYDEFPQSEKTQLFIEDLFTLTGLTGDVSTTQTVEGNLLIGGRVDIASNTTITTADEADFYFTDPNAKIYLNGDMHIGQNSLFKGLDGLLGQMRTETGSNLTVGTGTEFNTFLLEVTNYPPLDNLTFEDVEGFLFFFNGQPLTMNVVDCNFKYSGIEINSCDYTYVDNCRFDDSHLLIRGNSFTSTESEAYVLNNDFINYSGVPNPLEVRNAPYFNIDNNIMQNSIKGMFINQSGNGKLVSHFSNNHLHNNPESAVLFYLADASVHGNDIHDNGGIGAGFYNNSNIALYGNKLAQDETETQRIKDNGNYEVYADYGSFPHTFIWNAIIDDDNYPSSDELVYYDVGIFSNPKNVKNNHWGQNFDPLEDLHPYNGFNYEPIWNFWSSDPTTTSAGLLYISATENAENGDMATAQEEYKQLVEEYPDSKFAAASLKELYGIEALADNDYQTLKIYFETTPNIANDEILSKLANFLANRCDVKLENYEDAIAWYENVIANPPSYPEYIYAIIDLGYTYLLMEDGGDNKSSNYVGSMPEFKPKSDIVHRENTVFYLSLLPKKDDSYLQNELINMKAGELLQNVPNPFTTQTAIYYKLETEAKVTVKVFNTMGQQAAVFNEGHKNKGTHQLQFTGNNLSSGLYLYTLEINGKVSDSKKMTIR